MPYFEFLISNVIYKYLQRNINYIPLTIPINRDCSIKKACQFLGFGRL